MQPGPMWQPPPTSLSAVVWPWPGRPFLIKVVEPHVPRAVMHLLLQVVASVKILVQVAPSLKILVVPPAAVSLSRGNWKLDSSLLQMQKIDLLI